jgi:hypothetical protein
MAEESGITERAKKEMHDREVFRRVFNGYEGHSVLAWILNDNGYFSLDKDLITPDRIAFCNRLLNRLGVVHAMNLFEDTDARVNAANDKDLEEYMKANEGAENE